MQRILFIIIILFIISTPAYSASYDWWKKINTLKVLESTELDVISAFGKSNDNDKNTPFSNFYFSRSGSLYAEFLKEDCFKQNGAKIAQKGTLIYLSFEPAKRIKFSTFVKKAGIDLKEYDATTQKGGDTSLVYTDYEKPSAGISIQSTQDHFTKKWYLESITFMLPTNLLDIPCK